MGGGWGSVAGLVVWAVWTGIMWIGIPVGTVYTIRRFLRAYERRAETSLELRDVRQRMETLEGHVADLIIENANLRAEESHTRTILRSMESAARTV